MDTLLQDLRFGVRMLGKGPGFTVAAVATLALGIGAGTAIFSVVDAVLLRPLSYEEPDRLLMMWQTDLVKKAALVEVSHAEFTGWRDEAKALAGAAAVTATNFRVNLTGRDEPLQVEAALVSHELLPLLGVEPVHGRGFTAADDAPGAAPVAMVSHGFWQRELGADPAVVGRPLTLDGGPITVVGVFPPDLLLPRGADLWMPEGGLADGAERLRILKVVARLTPGATLAQARTEMDQLVRRFEKERAGGSEGLRAAVVPLTAALYGDAEPALWLLAAAVGALLLIACVNVANLLLARAADREREVALRAALGAARGRLVRQLLTESLVLALLGGGLGILLARWAVTAATALIPAELPRLEHIAVDERTLSFALVISLATVILFGLAPALKASQADPSDALKERTGRASEGLRGRRLRAGLVVSEIALSLVLVATAGLLVRSFSRFAALEPGFAPEGVLATRLQLSRAKYQDVPTRAAFYERLLARVEALPQVESAAVVLLRPLSDPIGWDYTFTVEEQTAREQETNPPSNYEAVSPGYFATLGIPLVAGRAFTGDDGTPDTPLVAIVNESMAKRFWPGEDPLGKRLKIGRPEQEAPWHTVVGVVADVRHREWGTVWMDLYVPMREWNFDRMDLVVRTAGDPRALVPTLRRAVRELDPDLPLASVTTMEEAVSRSLARPRFTALLLGLFAGAAMLLAAVGIYGIVAWSVARRTREIGVRRALGALAPDVLRLVVGQALALTLAGVVLGLGLALGATRAVAGLLYGVGATDPATFASAAALLAAAGLVAGCLPARRALRVEPVVALKAD